MREGEAEQRGADAHHLRHAAAKAQPVERHAEQIQEDDQEHVRRPGDRPQQRGMEDENERDRAGHDERKARGAKRQEPDAGQHAEEHCRHECGSRRASRRDHVHERGRNERKRRIGGDDATDRELAVSGHDGTGPQHHAVVGNEADPHREGRECEDRDEDDERDRGGGEKPVHDGVSTARMCACAWLETPCWVFSQ